MRTCARTALLISVSVFSFITQAANDSTGVPTDYTLSGYVYDGTSGGGSDSDYDGIPDSIDNCPVDSNANQLDSDGDGIGDVCDPTPNGADSDNDGVPDSTDNCPNISNADQADNDSDGLGNVCDPTPNGGGVDSDGDGVEDGLDNCPIDSNSDQSDIDSDGIGDVCDSDQDGDGVDNGSDNCPINTNSNQADIDSDGIGDVCDADQDGDGVADGIDNCPSISNSDQADNDSDGIGNVCDPTPDGAGVDTDGDGIVDGSDNCPNIANPDQADNDSDGIGNVCDSTPDGGVDTDGDGIVDGSDNCPNIANADQADNDSDGIGNVCDPTPNGGVDTDGDGIVDGSDNCPNIANADQADNDSDGIGNVCDSTPDGGVDTDGDGIVDGSDNCPNIANADQTDTDSDGLGDVCDSNPTGDTTDTDHDTIYDVVDNCPNHPNKNQSDDDGDGIGDMCETGSPTNCPSVGDVCDDGTVNLGGGLYLSADFGRAGWLASSGGNYGLMPVGGAYQTDTGEENWRSLKNKPQEISFTFASPTAEGLCENSIGGHDDWTVPSLSEWSAITAVLSDSFENGYYWTSTPSPSSESGYRFHYGYNPSTGATEEQAPSHTGYYPRCIRDANGDIDKDNISNASEIPGCEKIGDNQYATTCNNVSRAECSSPGETCRNGSVYVGLSPISGERMYLARLYYSTTYSERRYTGPQNTSTTDNWQDIYDDHITLDPSNDWYALNHCENLTIHGISDWHMPSLGEAMVYGSLENAWGMGLNNVQFLLWRAFGFIGQSYDYPVTGGDVQYVTSVSGVIGNGDGMMYNPGTSSYIHPTAAVMCITLQ